MNRFSFLVSFLILMFPVLSSCVGTGTSFVKPVEVQSSIIDPVEIINVGIATALPFLIQADLKDHPDDKVGWKLTMELLAVANDVLRDQPLTPDKVDQVYKLKGEYPSIYNTVIRYLKIFKIQELIYLMNTKIDPVIRDKIISVIETLLETIKPFL